MTQEQLKTYIEAYKLLTDAIALLDEIGHEKTNEINKIATQMEWKNEWENIN